MKIRNGFVSNSSSSSFLISYKNDDAFDKFNKFTGYDVFMKDMNNTEAFDKKVHDFIYYLIHEYVYEVSHCFREYFGDKDSFYKIDDIGVISGVNVFKYIDNNILVNINENKDKFWDNLEEIDKDLFYYSYVLWISRNNDVNEIINVLFEDKERQDWNNALKNYHSEIDKYMYSDDFEKKLNEITDKICEGFKKRGFIIKCLEYEDHDDIGSKMEHQFMPFLSHNPDGEFQVFIMNNH